ncbi:MAG TPA: FixH family protein [Devosia sp.]|jgi:nitrogen fixation protein FixH|uniref:FixH family protein n=1 Tax=Devosia sp. TaxID=1871048 RepID=UPI002DDCA386|nr:FixH family protein [Devosia sp.]HEV2516185.1 FixH family protein [Devosia sp.]
MTSPKAAPGEFTGRHMLLAIVGFFGVVIAVNVGMAVVSSVSWTGLVVQNSYVASQEFEAKRLAHIAQQQAGWSASLDYVEGRALLRVVDAAGRAVELGNPVLQINRPVGGHDDQQVVLSRGPDGIYAGPVALGPGVWEARVSIADTPRGPFELHERFSVAGAAP